MEEKAKWLRLDDDNGWQIVIPEADIKPHGFPEGKKKAELEYSNCPCKPKVDWNNRIIIHNSFEEQEKINQAMS